ncbi:hypothetical protein RYX36_008185 [Vicia faba]
MSRFNENQARINEREEFLSTKRTKRSASTNFDSKKEKQVSRREKEVSENSTKKVLISEDVGHHIGKKNREAQSDGSLEASHNRCTASNLCQSSGQNEAFHAEPDFAFKATLTPQKKTPGGNTRSEPEPDLQLKDLKCSQQTASSVKAQDNIVHGCGIEIPVNTVFSLLALDYPSNKLACYVFVDACSPLTFYALQEATKFVEIWVPFSKKYNVQCRAPFRYFCDKAVDNKDLPKLKQDWLKMKEEYEQLSSKIKSAAEKSIPCQRIGEFVVFSQTHVKNHQTIIKVIQRNKGLPDTMPRVIYISRERSSKHPHHHKVGAMNVLTRISGLMINASFILHLDCDMYVNNPKIVLHALCILLDAKGEKEVAFAQCPQRFCDAVKDDAYGNQLVALPMYIGGGFAGLQGIIYVGTNCFHRRKVIYGLSLNIDIQNGNKDHGFTKGTLLSEKRNSANIWNLKGIY